MFSWKIEGPKERVFAEGDTESPNKKQGEWVTWDSS